MKDFPKKYKFIDAEIKWQEFWKKSKIYKWRENERREDSYIIDNPPPTVSGQLHIGHVYSYTHADFIARFKRMKGFNVFYPMGFDDNGLPTERLVEKKKKIRANKMDRQEFIEICKEVVLSEEEKFRELFNKIALSVDWDNEYQTISPGSTSISQMSFLDLLNKGEIYRSEQPMLWDPVDQTALAQADIEEQENTTFMNDVAFSTEEGEDLIISTTRPELLPACVAMFYHPDDERYQHLAGKFAISPLFKIKVPIIADDLVSLEKGTGLVMCCTFGDQTDIIWWRKHKLPCKIMFTKYGVIDELEFKDECLDIKQAEGFYNQIKGLKIKDARKKMIDLLKENNILKNQTERSQNLKCAERSGAPLEILMTPQWFIKAIDHQGELLKRSNELNWHPKSMRIKLNSWISGLSLDWCISRQRFFGIPFPIWYSKRLGEEGKLLIAKSKQLPVDPLRDLPEGYDRDEVIADMDVMDTWSTSAVSPQLNSHGISDDLFIDKNRHKKLYPADLRPQAHEIIRTWTFYTMLKAHLHQDSLPWKNIMISGWCLSEDKSKMSKSKGNIIDPYKLLSDYGSDVVRSWAANSKLGADTAYSEDILKNGKKLINKIFNAAKFASGHFDKIPDELKALSLDDDIKEINCEFDRYFLLKLAELVKYCEQEFENYEYANAMSALESFFWGMFCDNYLEIVKTRSYGEDDAISQSEALSARLTLYHGLRVILQLFAPFVPHVTEELWNILYSEESIHQRGNWPKVNAQYFDYEKEGSEALIEVLEIVRKQKAYDNLSIKTPIAVLEMKGKKISEDLKKDLAFVISADIIRCVDNFSEIINFRKNDNNIAINFIYKNQDQLF